MGSQMVNIAANWAHVTGVGGWGVGGVRTYWYHVWGPTQEVDWIPRVRKSTS